MRGGGIAFLSKACGVTIQLVSTVILARLLLPSDYGVIAMVAAATALVGLFRDFGLSTASIQLESLTQSQQSNLFWINVACGALLTIATCIAAPAVAWFYGVPELAAVTFAMAPSFLIGSIGAQPSAAIIRDMLFGRQAAADIAGALSGLTLTIPLAVYDFHYWSLVWGGLLTTAVTSSFLLWLSPFRPGLPCYKSDVKPLLQFGANVTLFGVTEYVHRQADSILIGRVCGASELGGYSRAYSLLMVPLQALRGPVVSVAYPALSKLKGDKAAYIAYLKAVSSAIALLSIPSYAFGAVASDVIILTLLGEQWGSAAPIFTWLSLAGIVQPLGVVPGLINLSLGNSVRYRNWGFIKSVGVILAVCAGVLWGPVGVAKGYAVCSLLLFVPSIPHACSGTFVNASSLFMDYLRPVAAVVPACLVLVWIQESQTICTFSPASKLLLEATVFAVVFILCHMAIPGGLRQIAQPIGQITRNAMKART